MIEVEGITFTNGAIDFLRKHKVGPFVSSEQACTKQVQRARKQLRGIDDVLRSKGLQPKSILDIGCGLALVDILLARRYEVARIHLLDGDGTGSRRFGFEAGMIPWTDVRTSWHFVSLNLPPGAQAFCHVVGKPFEAFEATPLDLIISLKSWGFHYPISTYLELAKRWLRPGGLVILNAEEPAADEQMKEAGFDVVVSRYAYQRSVK